MSKDKQGQGAQRHAEGQHGEKTHEALINELESGSGKNTADGDETSAGTAANVYGIPKTGGHRLDEHREQHDIAEANSEADERRR